MNWIREPISDICDTTSGGTPSRKAQEYYQNGTIPWVKSGELENNIILDTEEYITEEALANSSAKIFPAGTLLIALYGATIGKLAFLGIPAATNQAVCAIFENKKVSLKYLYYYLLFKRSDLVKQGIGGAQPNISQAILKKLIIPYPVSISDQERIVSRIEELFSELDAGVETLRKTKQQLAVYRQAVIENAVLSANDGDIESEPFEKYIVSYQNGIAKRKGEGVLTPVIRLADIDNQRIADGNDFRTIGLSESERKKYLLDTGDILIIRVNGSEENVGRAIIVERQGKYAACDHFIRCVLDKRQIIPEFAQIVLNSFSSRTHIKKFMVSTAGQNTVSQGTMSSIKIRVPSIEKQEAIVSSVQERLSLCESIEKTVNKALQQSLAMRQSILKQALND